MSVVHRFTIPLKSNDQLYNLTVEVEDAPNNRQVFWVYGENHISPLESPTGMGKDLESAFLMFIKMLDLE